MNGVYTISSVELFSSFASNTVSLCCCVPIFPLGLLTCCFYCDHSFNLQAAESPSCGIVGNGSPDGHGLAEKTHGECIPHGLMGIGPETTGHATTTCRDSIVVI